MSFDISMEAISIGALDIRFYSLMILSGILAGVFIGQREANRLGEDPEHIVNIAVVGAIFALVGARTYHVIDQWNEVYSDRPQDVIAIWNGGIGIFGALAGSIVGLAAYVWWANSKARKRRGARPMRLLLWLDIGAPAFLIGQAVGRWGNFFNEELFGPPTDLPWGIPIDVANRPAQYLSDTHFHPLFFYESMLSLMGVAAMLYLARRFAHRIIIGDIFLFYFIWYGSERFALEFLRTDNWKVGAIPMAHVVTVLFIAAASIILILRHQRARGGAGDSPGVERAPSRATQRRRRRRPESGSSG